jgi:filamentous hemagglutinin family protein
MRFLQRYWFGLLVLVNSLAGIPHGASAQITPDATLPRSSIVDRIGNVYEITGGTTAGRNLFHSFREFSVPTNSSAFFNNSPSIQNILTRVTGNSISNIDGLLKANGSANLFLINPNGIIFGPNARLEIGGSFLATTANRVLFSDGGEFSANPDAQSTSPLLLVNVPVGLQFNGANNGAIAAQGNGNGLSFDPDNFSIVRPENRAGLEVQSGQTLALVGGDVTLQGANLIADSGRIELGSVNGNGIVGITETNGGWLLNYDNITQFGNIRLEQAAIADTSGINGGSIQVQGKQVILNDGSALVASTLGDGDGGVLFVHATELFAARGVSLDPSDPQFALFPSGLFTDVGLNANGQGSDIAIATPNLELTGGAQISASTASITGAGDAGDIRINASNILLQGIFDIYQSGIFSNVINTDVTGNGGDISIVADRIRVFEGAQIITGTFGIGRAGDLNITAKDITLVGTPIAPTGLSTSVQELATGDAGDVRITTDILSILDAAQISTSTSGSGNAGNLFVNARSIDIAGRNDRGRSGLFANAIIDTGSAGDIVINSDRLIVRDGGIVSVSNFPSAASGAPAGTGAVGDVFINSPSVLLDTGGEITANSQGGNRGDISIVSRLLNLRRGSSITTNALGEDTGGDITINTDFLVAIPKENSDITANAVNNFGGRTVITATGVLGFRTDNTRSTDFSDITATSALGAQFSGTVDIRTPETDLNTTLVKLPDNLTDPNNQIVAACERFRGNELIFTGNGGLPTNATQPLPGQSVWQDLRPSKSDRLPNQSLTPSRSEVSIATNNSESQPLPLTEAQSWQVEGNGKLHLLATAQQVSSPLSVQLLSALCPSKLGDLHDKIYP